MDLHAKVDAAAARLRQICTIDAINGVLAVAFSDQFREVGHDVEPRSAPALYTDAIRRAFYATDKQTLEPDYRECAVVALLASQQAEGNLALHLFIALVAGIRAHDVVDLLFLTGVYCGANVLTKSLRVANKTFAAVIQAADDNLTKPAEVFEVLLRYFPDPEMARARDYLRKRAAGGCG